MTRTYTFQNPHRVVLGRDASKGGSKRDNTVPGASKATTRGTGGTAGQCAETSETAAEKNKKDISIFAHDVIYEHEGGV